MRILKYNEAKLKLMGLITQEDLKNGDRIPSERELASLFGVSIISIRRAAAELQNAGILEKRQGSGSFYTGNLTKRETVSTVGILSVRDSAFPAGSEMSAMYDTLANYQASFRIFHVGDDIDTSIFPDLAQCDRFLLSGFCNTAWLDCLSSSGKPFVQIGSGLHHERVCQVRFDWEETFRQVFRRLKMRGKKTAGLLLIHPSAANCSAERLEMFPRLAAEEGISTPDGAARYIGPCENLSDLRAYFDGPGKTLDCILADYYVFANLSFEFMLSHRNLTQDIVIMQTERFLRDEVNSLEHIAQTYFPETILRAALRVLYESPYSFIERKQILSLKPALEGCALQESSPIHPPSMRNIQRSK